MNDGPGDQLKRLGKRGILTMPPEEGGITEPLCDMDECFRPTGRWDFEPVTKPTPNPIPKWWPSDDHFPKTKEVGGQKVAGNVRLAHRICNRADHGIRKGTPHEARRLRERKERWHRDHPELSAAIADRYANAEMRWLAMRQVTDVTDLEQVRAHRNNFEPVHLPTNLWFHVCRIAAHEMTLVYVGSTRPSSPDSTSLPFTIKGSVWT